MWITDYSMVNVGTDEEDCEMKKIRYGIADLKGAVVKKVAKDEIVIQLKTRNPGALLHIIAVSDAFDYTSYEGGKA